MAWLDVETGAAQTITTTPGSIWLGARVSPDGQYIAFTVRRQRTDSDVHVVRASGGDPVEVTNWPGGESVRGWLADGRLVLSGTSGGRTGLWTVTVKSGNVVAPPEFMTDKSGSLTRSGALVDVVFPSKAEVLVSTRDAGGRWATGGPSSISTQFRGPAAWSPDGAWLAWGSYSAGRRQADLMVWSEDKRSLLTIPTMLNSIYSLAAPVWTKDGQSVLIQGSSAEGQAFYRINVRTGEVTQLMKPVPTSLQAAGQDNRFTLHAMTPDERYYMKWGDQRSPDDPGRSRRMIWRVDARTGEETELVSPTAKWGVGPVSLVSPDGAWWAVTRAAAPPAREGSSSQANQGRSVVLAVPVAGGEPRQLCGAPISWAADGRSIFTIVARRDANRNFIDTELFECSMNGGEAQPTGIKVQGNIQAVAAHPDGRRLFYKSTTGGDAEIRLYEGFLAPKAAPVRR